VRVVVTGASGNVGTSVIEALAADREVQEIVGVARRVPGRAFPKVSWVQADVSEVDLTPTFRGADVVIHLAWLIQPSRDEGLTRRVNVDGSRRVFEAVARAETPALVYASSVGAYAPHPGGEPVDESWPTTGVASSFYSRHKASVEAMLDEFELRHPALRVVRLRPALIFKRDAATEIRRLFIGPLLPNALVRTDWLPAFPYPRGLRTQLVHSADVGEAYRLAAVRPVSGAFNIASEPVLDAAMLERLLEAKAIELPPPLVRALAAATWRLRAQPTSPGWLDMGMQTPIMDFRRAREELGWTPRRSAQDTLLDLLSGLRAGAAIDTPPLSASSSGAFRWRELLSGVGGTDRVTVLGR
jgi:UDP-glucose 4-epimerase